MGQPREVDELSVHEHAPVPKIDGLSPQGDDALDVWDGRVGRRVEHDDVAALRRPEAVVELAHQNAVVLQQRRFHRALPYLGHLNDEQVEDDGNDDRERERLDDLENRAPRKRRFPDGFVVGGRGDRLGSCQLNISVRSGPGGSSRRRVKRGTAGLGR